MESFLVPFTRLFASIGFSLTYQNIIESNKKLKDFLKKKEKNPRKQRTEKHVKPDAPK